MSSATIYARVPTETKGAAEHYAAERGLTLTSALNELLGLGLEAAANASSIGRMEEQLGVLQDQLRVAEMHARECELDRQRVERELESVRRAAAVWAERADAILGACPACNSPLSGRDLLVAGCCRKCHQPTAELIEPKSSELNKNDLMLTLGGIGLLLGILVIATKSV